MLAQLLPLAAALLLEPRSGTLLGRGVRSDFPLLDQNVWEGKPLVYLDSAATSQKPAAVLEAMARHQSRDNANVHRGAHALSVRSTDAYEAARDKVAAFVHASSRNEIVFTRGATEAINLVAQTWGRANLREGDEVVLSVIEHHSNIVPWQLLAEEKGIIVRFARLNSTEQLDVAHLQSLLVPGKTKLVSIAHVSNVLGCVAPVSEVVAAARQVGALVLLDACQSVPHMPVDVAQLGCDFLVASGHKMCGPTGVGFLWGRYSVLETMPPWQGGGEMIDQVTTEGSTYLPPPARFEAGTPAITQAIGLGAACDYLTALGMDNVMAYEHELGEYLYHQLQAVPGVRIFGPPPSVAPRSALAAFTVAGLHPSDLATFVDQDGIAIRAGHHCTQPLHAALGQSSGSARASLYIYSTREEVDAFIEALTSTIELFQMMED